MNKEVVKFLLAAALLGFTVACQSVRPAGLALPELVNEGGAINNDAIGKVRPAVEFRWVKNSDAMRKIMAFDSPETRRELRRRLNGGPEELRLLYAGMLARVGDKTGQDFLLKRGQRAKTPAEARNVFWVIGRLQELLASEDGKTPGDMRWAEAFMLAMMAEPRTLKDSDGTSCDRQELALEYGFGESLAEMKCRRLYPVLMECLEKMADGDRRQDVIAALGCLGDRRAVPRLVAMLAAEEDKGELFSSLADSLAKLGAREAVPVLLRHLDDDEVYGALATYDDPRILPALRQALPGLHDPYVRTSARLLIIKLEGGDRLSKLVLLARESQATTDRDDWKVMGAIAELKDRRAVPFALEILHASPSLHRRINALFILAGVEPSRESVRGLIDALGMDFQVLAKGKAVASDNNEKWHGYCTRELRRLTGQDYGADKQKWLEWYERTGSRP